MTLVLELPPEVETRLRAAAAREGVDVDVFAQKIIQEHLPPASPEALWESLSPEDWTRRFEEWVATHSDWPQLPPEAYERASFYEDPESGLPRGY
ncbi:MAG: hypothetical protein ACO1SX_23055 [Actinomycetota bacterium]